MNDPRHELERILIHMSHAAAELIGAMNSKAITVTDLRSGPAATRLRYELGAFHQLLMDNVSLLDPGEMVTKEELAALTAPLANQ